MRRIGQNNVRGYTFIVNELGKRVLPLIMADYVRAEDIKSQLGGDHQPRLRTLARVLQELEWLGYIEIQNFEEDLIHWQARRVEP
jgi:hypothetical protein